jgi:hypothetical protein
LIDRRGHEVVAGQSTDTELERRWLVVGETEAAADAGCSME